MNEIERARLRVDVGWPTTHPADDVLDDLFVRAAEEYPGNLKAQKFYARVLAVGIRLAEAVDLVDYTQGSADENLSQITKHLEGMRKRFQGELDSSTASAGIPRFGPMVGYRKRY